MPVAPPAPTRFSTTTVCFSSLPSASATGRATVSATPPGGKGTIMVMGLSAGQPWAQTAPLASRPVAVAINRVLS